jgi:peptidoglycan/LPS O-acetylase OafA/YrhL
MRMIGLNKRLLELDVFRGLAALCVVLYHYTDRFQSLYGYTHPLFFHLPFGHYGVQLFFMISGFVIFMTLVKTEKKLDFLVSRFSRLCPAYWTAVIVSFLIITSCSLPDRQVSWHDALLNLTMLNLTPLQKILNIQFVDTVYWTLAVELLFYAIMLLLFTLRQLVHIHWICAAWLLLQLASALCDNVLLRPLPAFIRVPFILSYANLFIAGIMFYHLKNHLRNWSTHLIILTCLLIQGLVAPLESLIPVALFFLFFYLFVYDRMGFLALRPLVFLGTISYSLYLIHQNVGYVILRSLNRLPLPSWLILSLALAAIVLLASLLTFTIEKPALKAIRARYARRKAARSPAPKKLESSPSA